MSQSRTTDDSRPFEGTQATWAAGTEQKGRIPPRECVRNARDALNRTYAYRDRAPIDLLVEAVDWLRRALEQMTDDPRKAD